MNKKHYSRKEIEEIMAAYNSGMKVSEIALCLGRPVNGIHNLIIRLKKKQMLADRNSKQFVAPEHKEKTLSEYSYEEIIRYLYSQGFRIQDNQLMHITATPVKIENII